MTSRADRIALAVISEFDKLPPKRKPLVRGKDVHEWVPLSGIIAEEDGQFQCLVLATGMKCLPESKLPQSQGVGIHDWHAEVLAIRTLNRYLLDECHRLKDGSRDSNIILEESESSSSPFRIRPTVKLHMYCSEAPCGDASMELTMAAQPDAIPWEVPNESQNGPAVSNTLPGRAYFDKLGIVRRKPSRGDAPPTSSKSCSDKIALKQCTSLLSAITSLFVRPENAYIDTLVLPKSQYSETGFQRSFSRHGRMKLLDGRSWPGGHVYKPFSVETTDVEFSYSRRSVLERAQSIAACNLATAWSLSGIEETILGGVIQGRKAFDVRGASQMSRRQMWKKARTLAEPYPWIQPALQTLTYRQVKEGPLLAARRGVKSDARSTSLTGWQENDGDSDFQIDHET